MKKTIIKALVIIMLIACCVFAGMIYFVSNCASLDYAFDTEFKTHSQQFNKHILGFTHSKTFEQHDYPTVTAYFKDGTLLGWNYYQGGESAERTCLFIVDDDHVVKIVEKYNHHYYEDYPEEDYLNIYDFNIKNHRNYSTLNEKNNNTSIKLDDIAIKQIKRNVCQNTIDGRDIQEYIKFIYENSQANFTKKQSKS